MKSVVICCSRKFEPEARRFANSLKKLGITVYEPYLTSFDFKKLKESSKLIQLGLTHDHLYKIKMADVVYLYNKNGYSGVSTTLEIGAAVALGKPIYAYSDEDAELARTSLFREIIKSPRKLYKKLK